MNENTRIAEREEPGGEAGQADEGEEGSSSPAEPAQERPPLLERLSGVFRWRNGSSLREDLADALSEHAEDAASFSPGERAMLKNILRLRELRVEDVMVPRADIQAVDTAITLGELLATFERSGHSRMPVYGETLDDPRGMVHIRDVVGHLTRTARQKNGRGGRKATGAGFDLARVDLGKSLASLNLMRPLLFVPPSMLASDLMARMQAARIQMALVIDEYGGTDGLVSLEDIVEMVVGDIEDEHDEDEPMIREAGDGVYVVDAKAEIEDVAEAVGSALWAEEHAEDVDTIGGMIFNALGRVPARGEVVQAVPGFEFHVLDADPRRVKRVRIVRGGERRRRQQQRPADV